ncbi:MAG: IS3 family transposase [Crocinitomicaceae bacterium]|nr:IS3 family transposase [Crocinitomicaceae bacterium]
MRERKLYSKEFKIKAVELSNVRGNIQEIARELDVKPELIYRWRKELGLNPSIAFAGNGKKQLTEEQKEIARLKRKLADMEMERDIFKKGREHLLRERPEIFQFIKDHQREFPVGRMCKVFKVSRSRFYEWRNYIPSNHDNENRALLFEIRRIHEQSKASYGSPRITDELKSRGFKASKPRVARLMKKNGIRAVHAKKFVVTTDSKHKYPVVENKLDRNFSAQKSAQVWVSDITYIRTMKGWLYLTIILDLYDRKVIGWALSTDMSAENTTIAAWRMAIKNRPATESLVFHSDRGIQYACKDFADLVASYKNVERSMSRKGNCWDNAVAESFFKTLKVEHVYRHKYLNSQEASLSVFEWIETWYNRNRRHSALGNLTINEFEKLNQLKNVA